MLGFCSVTEYWSSMYLGSIPSTQDRRYGGLGVPQWFWRASKPKT